MELPKKYNDPEVKKQSVAVKYRAEQELTAHAAIEACITKNYALELYAGTGGLTKIYRKHFIKVDSNDINPLTNTKYHLDAMKFIKGKIINFSRIDLIDFDCYGCPALVIQEYFKVKGNFDAPFVIRFSDGLGLYLKRNKNEKVLRDRYLIEGPIVWDRIWLRHPELIDYFFKKIAGQYGMQAEKICAVQTKYLNYTLGVYRFTNI